MEFKQVGFNLLGEPFEVSHITLTQLAVRDDYILNNPGIFPRGYILLTLRGNEYVEQTNEPLICLRTRTKEILGYLSITILEGSNPFIHLSKTFPHYLSIVSRFVHWLKCDIDQINLISSGNKYENNSNK